jgi:hypothetical protein
VRQLAFRRRRDDELRLRRDFADVALCAVAFFAATAL